MSRKGRKKTNKKRSQRLLILCEGKTEFNYFNAIRADEDYKDHLRGMSIAISTTKKSCPLDMVKEADKKQKQEKNLGFPYDQVWIVFDHDNKPKRRQAFELARKKKYKIAFSSFCFEVWFILHFTHSVGTFQNAKQAENTLKKHWQEYEKTRLDHFKKLKPRLPIALENTTQLKNKTKMNYPNEHLFNYNPYCDVDDLILSLTNLS